MFDLVTIAIALGTFAAMVGGYALYSHCRATVSRIDSERLARMTRRTADAGRFIGGNDKLGDN